MKKKQTICIVGMQYDMSIMDIDYVKQSVQEDLDYIYSTGKIQFEMIEDANGAYHLLFKRKYGEWYTPERTVFCDEKMVFSPDAHILLGTNRKNYPTDADLEKWANAYIHYLPLADVEKEYQKSSKTKVQILDVEERDGEVKFIIGI